VPTPLEKAPAASVARSEVTASGAPDDDIDYLKNDLAQLDGEILQLQHSLARVQARAHSGTGGLD
jgi:hypothetical protein